jgi:tetratricopeptide (TPR) repeat protein
MSATTDPDRLAELEEERRFLLRSLDDLEREHDAGDVDEHDFATLRDGYVARAAAVLREIDDGRAALPPPRRRPARLAAVVLVTLAFAAFAGWLVARSSGQRDPGGAVSQLPADELSQQLSLARNALAAGDFASAFQAFQRVRELDPNNVEGATYLGWVAVLTGRQSNRADLVDLGVAQLRQAITLDPTYTDAHCLLGVALVRFVATPDPVAGRSELAACLAANPPQEVRALVEPVLASLDDPTSSAPAGTG